ncbi:Rpn family recombination-promoting nuclease/putative transposase [Flavobacterium branchiophilum]|uniref:Putative transposase/invertase (TIGR01784 family) n=1 Tax=Flavobacterium branchiophilum TaxID=55197 RepID=A0A543G3A7_9FLAO|nr:Rpn family recombination-promoting nuclease/putative transposase [Flavobacterium branchiophilum]TQM40570.1 putative transposase/invertase (TIGR01784 family) [Flavobacterium branchiophilum]
MRYLDPKNDLVFKRIFGEHPHLLMSLLNELLPLEVPIKKIKYLPTEMVPRIPVFKNSIVDVRCYDENDRQFIVEMQMLWTDSFKSRVVFNASKAYIKQIERGEEYKNLEPVYSLSIVNEVFEPLLDDYFHHYKITHTEHSDKIIEGLEFIFIELPKFKSKQIRDKKLNVLWLRFLSEIKDGQEDIPDDFKNDPSILEASEYAKESAYTKSELEAYDRYWDSISSEKTLITEAYDVGKVEGKIEGKVEGKIERDIEIILNGYNNGFSITQLVQLTNLTEQEVLMILRDNGIEV